MKKEFVPPIKFKRDGYYEVEADKIKNRLRMSATGMWSDPADMPNFNSDTKNAVSHLKKGYTALVSLIGSKPPSFKMTGYLKENQQIMISAGLKKSAVVVDENSKMLQKFVMNVLGKLSKVPFKAFDTLEEAEAFLAA
ncbi:MAG: hypothetical protein KAW12_16605 [Candidatus Aminicenantes bacterium]|nr:hypothetical protein [Candidatus Aminicenantes bacterium]